ncbi:hypothetical protein Godav_028635 [Gossypium davidsonii]|uniref:40S ribosomal protein S7 n=1 Tax=Gossypium davidsonii TaxID=34287 RepID=A0A7J8S0Z5_GOSDV|nr:hypothetical protein [Gossypium davidsonii]
MENLSGRALYKKPFRLWKGNHTTIASFNTTRSYLAGRLNLCCIGSCMLLLAVVVLANGRILRPPKKGSAFQPPRTRAITGVHGALLEDRVHPAEIVGKRT